MKLHRPPILMYHSIADLADDPNMLCTSPQRFAAQMLYLKQRGLRGVSVRELRRAMSSGVRKGFVGLTFDDGYKDFLSTAVPILERLGFSATVFAVAGMLGEENDWEHTYTPRPHLKLLTAEELRVVAERGMEVGSHSTTHPRLTRLEPERLDQETDKSRRVLSEILGEEVEGFCYPYGSLDGPVLSSVSRAGYAYACAWNTRVKRNAFDLPRIPISNKDSSVKFAAKLRIYPQYARAKKVISTPYRALTCQLRGQGL
jgi:peptidoglycan/xylan/chitin deacetylase (PgdA/CDA1 family)